MEQVDADGDDVIDQREFTAIMAGQAQVEVASKGGRVVQSFQVFDPELYVTVVIVEQVLTGSRVGKGSCRKRSFER